MSFKPRFSRNFPFDDDDNGFRSRLDDIAQRYPEFADHLNPSTWGRRHRASASPTRNADIFARLRPHFADFDFPFEDAGDAFDRRFEGSEAKAARPEEQPPAGEERVNEKPPKPSSSAAEEAPPVSERSRKAPIQQSNTVDLGQPQAPLVDEQRTQRSMSAPPENPNAGGGKRFVSSINIPNVNAEMGGVMSQPDASQAPESGMNPKERIIPIRIEGRSEPIIPKMAQPTFAPRPSTFTPTSTDAQQQTPPPSAAKPSSLELIQNIQKDVSALMLQVEGFEGKPRDKNYVYLDEMLTRKMLLLDNIDTGGQDSIRKARKEAIKCIQDTIKVLENKAQSNEEKSRFAFPFGFLSPNGSGASEISNVMQGGGGATVCIDTGALDAAVQVANKNKTEAGEPIVPQEEKINQPSVTTKESDVGQGDTIKTTVANENIKEIVEENNKEEKKTKDK